GGRGDARHASRRGIPRRRRAMGASAPPRAPGPAAAVAAVPARRAAHLADAGLHPFADRVWRHAGARLVAARVLGGGACRTGGRQRLPATRALAAAEL